MVTHMLRCKNTSEMDKKRPIINPEERGITCEETTQHTSIQQDHVYSNRETEGRNESQTFPSNSLSRKPKRKICKKCGKSIHFRWLKNHMKIHEKGKLPDITENRHHHSVVIDAKEGVFCSSINLNGPYFPVHVVKKTSGSNQESFCEHQPCIDLKETAKNGGNMSFECAHVRSASYARQGKDINMDTAKLKEMRDKRFLTDQRYLEILTFKENVPSGTPLLVQLPHEETSSDRFTYLSVYSSTRRYWSVIGRTVVTFDKLENSYSCRCSRTKRYCIHKALGKWFVCQEMPEYFVSNECDGNDVLEVDETVTTPTEESTPGDTQVYTSERNKAELVQHYIKSTKQIPAEIPKEIANVGPSPTFLERKEIIPSETRCHRCNSKLNAEVIRNRAKLILMKGIIRDVLVYAKICPKCRTTYRYQEWSEGLHNFNDSVFLGIDVCCFLRSGLQNHVAIGRSLSILEDLLGEKLYHVEVQQAYLHFEALCDHSYDFNCVVCGYHPPIIIWDTFRKASFKFVVSDMDPPSDNPSSDEVNLVDFWERVKNCLLQRGICRELSKDLEVKPNYICWSPWIGKHSRKDDFAYNTEYRKCSVGSDDGMDEPVAEETLLHLLKDEKVTCIRRVCREAGIKAEGSTMDMILRLREKSITRSSFDKAYEKIFGCSGGWAVGCCRHGIIYCIKNLLRSESPRDYIDMERTLKHRPTISVSDIAHLVASHGNKTVPGFYQPHEGRLAAQTEANLTQAENGEAFSVAFMKEPENHYNQNDANTNPVTGSRQHLSLFDWFHEGNCKKREEQLRKSSLLEEMAGLVDTQAVEQLFSSCKKDLYFLNNLNPCNHMFVFRLLCHLRNLKKNARIFQTHSKQFSSLGTNSFGQLTQCFPSNQTAENDVDNIPHNEEYFMPEIVPAFSEHEPRQVEVEAEIGNTNISSESEAQCKEGTSTNSFAQLTQCFPANQTEENDVDNIPHNEEYIMPEIVPAFSEHEPRQVEVEAEIRNTNISSESEAQCKEGTSTNSFGQLTQCFPSNKTAENDVDNIPHNEEHFMPEIVPAFSEHEPRQVEVEAEVRNTNITAESEAQYKEGTSTNSGNDAEELSNFQLIFSGYSSLTDALKVAVANANNLTPVEMKALKANTSYASNVLLRDADASRREQVKVIDTDFGLFQVQGKTNYCGLCAINNAIGIQSQVSPPFAINEMDALADELWLSMINDPSHGVLLQVECMRDREGFYSIEVLQATLNTKGYQMLPLNPLSLTALSSLEVGLSVIRQLTAEFGMCSFIIRLCNHLHWISVRVAGDHITLFDSSKTAPSEISSADLGTLIMRHCRFPGAVYFVIKDDHEPSKNQESQRDMITQEEGHSGQKVLTSTKHGSSKQDSPHTKVKKSSIESVPLSTSHQYNLRKNTKKRESSSWIYYPPGPKKRPLHCVCNKPDDGKLYWQCEECKRWFHPGCVNAENEPNRFICISCTDEVYTLPDIPTDNIYTVEKETYSDFLYNFDRVKTIKHPLDRDARDLLSFFNINLFHNKLPVRPKFLRWTRHGNKKVGKCIGKTTLAYFEEERKVPGIDIHPFKHENHQDVFETLLHECIHAFLYLSYKENETHDADFTDEVERCCDKLEKIRSRIPPKFKDVIISKDDI